MPKPVLDSPPTGICVCVHSASQHAYGWANRLGVCRVCGCDEFRRNAWWAKLLRRVGIRA